MSFYKIIYLLIFVVIVLSVTPLYALQDINNNPKDYTTLNTDLNSYYTYFSPISPINVTQGNKAYIQTRLYYMDDNESVLYKRAKVIFHVLDNDGHEVFEETSTTNYFMSESGAYIYLDTSKLNGKYTVIATFEGYNGSSFFEKYNMMPSSIVTTLFVQQNPNWGMTLLEPIAFFDVDQGKMAYLKTKLWINTPIGKRPAVWRDLKFKIIDSYGHTVFEQKKVTDLKGEARTSFKTNNLEPGTYDVIVTYDGDEETVTKPCIIHSQFMVWD